MSSGGQIAGGIIGAVVGFVVAGPAGALYGASLGMAVGGYLDPPKGPTVEGPRLNDLKVQTSTYGVIVPRVYGMIGISGNVLWLENNQLKETVKKKKQGGKGGGSSSTLKTYSYSATFALGLCEGTIAGVRRIWCGDKLIYNAGSNDLETIIASNRVATGFKIYYGTDDQLPDARYEANVGVGNAPAFRGLAYIVFYDFQLADYGNSLQGAQFKVEVVKKSTSSEFYLLGDTQCRLSGSGSIYAPHKPIDDNANWRYSFYSDSLNKLGIVNSVGMEYEEPDNYALSSYTKLWNNNYIRYFDGDFPYGVCEGGSQSRLYFRSGNKFYKYPGSTIFDYFNIVSGFVYGNSIYFSTEADGGTRKVIKIVESGVPFSALTATVADAEISMPYGYSACFRHGDTLAVLTPSNKIRMYSLDDLSFLGEVSIGGVSFPEFTNYHITIEHGGYIFIIYSFVSDYSGHIYFKSSLDEEAKTFFLDSGGDVISYVSASNGVLGAIIYDSSTLKPKRRLWKIINQSIDDQPINEIIADQVDSSGLISQSDIDSSLLSDIVSGYKSSGGTIRSALEPLQGAFPFDIRQHGYQLQLIPRGRPSSASIDFNDLGASADGEDPIVETVREMDSQLPARTTIKYIDAQREYSVSEQSAVRLNTSAVNRVDRDLPIVLTADKAAQVAEVLEFLPWLERSDFTFTLPQPYLCFEPADVVTIPAPSANYELRLIETNETPDGRIECKARLNRAALYSSNAKGGEAPGPDGAIGVSGESTFIPLDIPVVDETVQNSSGFVGVMTSVSASWPGGVIYRSFDDGQTWIDLQGYSAKGSIGRARGFLAGSDCLFIDQSSLVVDMISGSLESITRDQMLSGNHYVAYGVDGRWEIIRFQNATLQSDGSFLVSGFVRGEFGTEWASGLHSALDLFVVLGDPDNVFIGMSNSVIGTPGSYRAVTNGSDLLTATVFPFNYKAVNLECLSPVYAKGSRDGSGNFTGSFTRRSRISGTWWSTGTPTPIGELSESYEIDVMSGSTVKRTIVSTSESFSYSAANQVSDFGSAQSAITFRIYQMSAVVGRGYPLEVTL